MAQPPAYPPRTGAVPEDFGEPAGRPAPGQGVRSSQVRRWALVVTLASVLGVWLVWRVFVLSRTGQELDEAAFVGAEFGQNRLLVVAEPVLSVISIPFIAVVLLAAMLLAFLRRRALLAVQVAVLVGGANLTTQVLKHSLLERPDLGVGDRLSNALPSGHTTAAASVAAALLFVVPQRFRPTAAVLGVAYTVATGVSTLVGRWHRPSDAVAAVLVVLAWAGIASGLGGRTWVAAGKASAGKSSAPGTLAVAWGLVAVAAGSAVGAAIALRRGLDVVGRDAVLGRADLLAAYGGGALGVLSVTCLAFGVLLLLRRLADHPTR